MRKIVLLSGLAMAALGPMTALEASRGRFLRDPTGHPTSPLATLQALQTRRTALLAELRGIIDAAEAEDRDLTAEEQTTFDAQQAALTALDARIARFTGVQAAESVPAAVIPAAARGNGPGAPPGPEARREFESLGEFMHAVRFNQNDQRLNYVENAGANGEGGQIDAAMRMDNDTQGGFMVPPQLRSEIMRVDPQDALVRPRATVIPAGSPPDAGITIPALDQSGANPKNMFGGVEFKWIGEGEEKPETDAKLKSITLVPHEIAGFVTITDKLLRNWQASGAFIEGLFRGAAASAEDFAFLRGTGSHQPLGAINAPATKWVNRLTANQVKYEDLVAMVSRILMRGGSPVWSIPQSVLPQLLTMTDPEGHYIWKANSAVDAAVSGIAGTLLGYPVRWNNRSPNLGSKGDLLLADWSQYLIKDGSGPFVATSEHVKFTSNQTVIKFFWNVDGAPWLNAPIVEENGWEVSPFVGLDVPA
ncbi:phage major capsid protein [Novosphingobium sp. fls2-241-R2A-195]|uniref:phage major capsid protein n=1 Tax=Novosphingobium sp. fls2-241-R2A-195 TaxID=3040296 RepID=UPI00254E02B1|nr:phage major capsid protein [Novosphingobium sp. fls2-241-R2A-195]